MASPFRVFRKHQKVLIATLGCAAMIAFVFLSGPVLSLIGRSGARDPVVVSTTAFGDITKRELYIMTQARARLANFFKGLTQKVYDAGGESRRAGELAYNLENSNQQWPEKAAVDTWVLAREAERLGIVVSDQAIEKFLKETSDNKVDGRALEGLVKGCEFNRKTFFAAMRELLLAERLSNTFINSINGVPPGQRWDYFNRLNRHVDAEVAGISVSDFIKQIPTDPSDEELKEFFDKYKEDLPHINSPEVGFRVPHRIMVEYFEANIAELASEENVTNAEVMAEYRRNKEMYDTWMASRADAAATAGGTTKPDTSDKATPGEEGATEEDKTEDDKTENGAANEGTSEDTSKEDATGETDAADTSTSKESGEDGEKPADAEKPTDGETSRAAGDSPFKLTAYLQTDAPAADAPAPKEDALKTDAPKNGADEAAAKPEDGTTEEPTDAAAKGQESGTTNQTPAEPVPEPVAETPNVKGALPEWARTVIRRQIADQKVNKAFDVLKEEMMTYSDRLSSYDNREKGDTKTKKPATLDFKALAEKYGLKAGKTKMVSREEVQQFEGDQKFGIGRSSVDDKNQFAATEFDRKLPYMPETSTIGNSRFPGVRYLFWHIANKPGGIPKFDDPGVKDRVMYQWKMIEARKLAMKKAEELAEIARKEGKSLSDTFADKTDIVASVVSSTGPFSWMTRGTVPGRGRPRLSSVEGVDRPGTKFMEAVAELGVGQIGVAMNMPETVVYIIRVTKVNETDDQLWTLFTAVGFDQYAAAGGEDYAETYKAWKEQIEKSAGLKWERKADPPRVEEETEE